MEVPINTLSILSATSLALLVVLYYRYKNIYSYWKLRNVKGPKPYYVVGHFLHVFTDYKTQFLKNCVKQYGRIYGIYEGHEPVLMIADAELARQICIKDFDIFPNHKVQRMFNSFQRKFIFSLQDNHWRRVRALMSPTFTSGKMRRMVRLLDKCVDDLVLSFEEQIQDSTSGEKAEVDLKETYSLYTMDAITTCCFALKLERVKSATNLKMLAARNELVSQAMELFKFDFKRFFVMFATHEKILDLIKFEALPTRKLLPLMNKVSKLIEGRKRSERKFEDYLQLLVDARLDDQVDLDEFDLKENHHAGLTNEYIKSDQEKLVAGAKADLNGTETATSISLKSVGFMDDEEILSNAVFLMVVGLETTANLLTCCSYALAFHKDAQGKLRAEIKKISKFDSNNNPTFDYDTVTSCQYLDAVISETLRILTPVLMTDRVCNQDYYIDKCNVTLPKGSKVNIHFSGIMTDPEYWPEPYKFDPERFMPENKEKIVPGSYCPFGLGSRHCLGMRFSLTESKLALAKMIMKFEFDPAPGTSFPPENKPNLGLRQLKKPIASVRLVKD